MTQTSYFAEHPMSAAELRTLDPRRTMSIEVLRSTGVLDNLHAEAECEMPPAEPVWDAAGGQRVRDRRDHARQGVTQQHYRSQGAVQCFGVRWDGQRTWAWTCSSDVELL